MGIVHDAVTSLIGTPTNFVGEIIFTIGEFFLVVIIMMGIWLSLTRLIPRR